MHTNFCVTCLLLASFSCLGQDHNFHRIMFFKPLPEPNQKIAELKISAFIMYDLAYDSTRKKTQRKLQEYHFDNRGNLIEDIFYNTDHTGTTATFITRDVYRYDNSGLPLEHRRYENGNNTADWVKVFNNKESAVHERNMAANEKAPVVSNTVIYVKREGDKCVEADSTDDGIISTYFYEHNKLAAVNRVDKKTDADDTTRYWYDKNGNWIKYTTTLVTCEQDVAAFERKYDAKNRIISEIVKTAMNETNITKFTYNSKSITLRREYYDHVNKLLALTIAEYNANTLKRSEIRYDSRKKPTGGHMYEYVYR